MTVLFFGHPVELQINAVKPGSPGPNGKLSLLSKANSVGRHMKPMEAHTLSVLDCVQEDWGKRCFAAGEQDINLSLRFERHCSFKHSGHILHIQFMDIAGGVGVHVARRTEHVTAVGKVDDQVSTASRPDTVCAVIVNHFVADTIEVLAKRETLHPFEESRMIRKDVFKRTMLLAGLAHENAACFLQDLGLDDSGTILEID